MITFCENPKFQCGAIHYENTRLVCERCEGHSGEHAMNRGSYEDPQITYWASMNSAYTNGVRYRESGQTEYTPSNPPFFAKDRLAQKHLARYWITGWCDADMVQLAEDGRRGLFEEEGT